MKLFLSFAIFLNVVLLFAAWNTVFLQTHWNDVRYVALVLVVVGTPVVNVFALTLALRRAANSSHSLVDRT